MSDVIWERDEYPPEPAGPVWDQDGGKWELRPSGWLSPSRGGGWTWNSVCAHSRKLTSAPPWEPEVGGTVETEEQYAALPEGSIVAADDCLPKTMSGSGHVSGLALVSRTILRVGWES